MIPVSETFAGFLRTWFDPIVAPGVYVEGCERAQGWLADPGSKVHEFRDELAAHLRDSSFPPPDDESQWSSDEILRSLWFDVFGPEAAPDDPFPVPPTAWGRERLTWYLLNGVGPDAEHSSPGAEAWLSQRGLSFAEAIAVKELRRAGSAQPRPEPAGWAKHLDAVTRERRREARPGEQ